MKHFYFSLEVTCVTAAANNCKGVIKTNKQTLTINDPLIDKHFNIVCHLPFISRVHDSFTCAVHLFFVFS